MFVLSPTQRKLWMKKEGFYCASLFQYIYSLTKSIFPYKRSFHRTTNVSRALSCPKDEKQTSSSGRIVQRASVRCECSSASSCSGVHRRLTHHHHSRKGKKEEKIASGQSGRSGEKEKSLHPRGGMAARAAQVPDASVHHQALVELGEALAPGSHTPLHSPGMSDDRVMYERTMTGVDDWSF